MSSALVGFTLFLITVISADLSIRFADFSLLPINAEFLNDDSSETCTGFQKRNISPNYGFTQFRINTSYLNAKNLTITIIGSSLGCGRDLYASPLSDGNSEMWIGRWTSCKLQELSKHRYTESCSYSCGSSCGVKYIQMMRLPYTSDDLYWEACHIRIVAMSTGQENVSTGCSNITDSRSGVYEIKLPNSDNLDWVYCDQQTEGGGWTVLLRRIDGSVNYTREWQDYKYGFGTLTGEFWIGNELMHKMTSGDKPYSLRVELLSYEGEFVFAEYSTFLVGPESDNYRLRVGGYQTNSTAGDSFSYHDGMMFSTASHDNDVFDKNCCLEYGSSWWHNRCHWVFLTGKYGENLPFAQGITWRTAWGYNKFARFARMMIRPA